MLKMKEAGCRQICTGCRWFQPNLYFHSCKVVWVEVRVSQLCLLSSSYFHRFPDLTHSNCQSFLPLSFITYILYYSCALSYPIPTFQLASSNFAVVFSLSICLHQLCFLYSKQCFLIHSFFYHLMCDQIHPANFKLTSTINSQVSQVDSFWLWIECWPMTRRTNLMQPV
jgi:hypothetical protein